MIRSARPRRNVRLASRDVRAAFRNVRLASRHVRAAFPHGTASSRATA